MADRDGPPITAAQLIVAQARSIVVQDGDYRQQATTLREVLLQLAWNLDQAHHASMNGGSMTGAKPVVLEGVKAVLEFAADNRRPSTPRPKGKTFPRRAGGR